MTYEEFIKFLNGEFERLEKVEHVSDLLNNGQYDKLKAVISKIDYSHFYKFMQNTNIGIPVSEILEEYGLVSAIYFSGNKKYDDNEITGFYEDYVKMLYNYGEVGKCIGAALMGGETINGFDSIKELIEIGKKYLEEDGDMELQ